LAKDLTLAVVDGRRGLGNGRVIPAGPLRASLDMQLELTDGVVVNEPTPGSGEVADWLRHRFAGPVLRASTAPASALDWLKERKVLAWAGIGAPERFFSLLRALGADLSEGVSFPDHHRLSQAEAGRLLAAAGAASATLVTTEKDAARLRGESGTLAELLRQSRPVPVRLQFSAQETERLAGLVDAALRPV
jgi:tetraacyldisaccharide 4'-kinase